MIYSFIKVYEMDYTEIVFECVAKDFHQALMLMAMIMDTDNYDCIVVNGELTY